MQLMASVVDLDFCTSNVVNRSQGLPCPRKTSLYILGQTISHMWLPSIVMELVDYSNNQVSWSCKYMSVVGALDTSLQCKKGVDFGKNTLWRWEQCYSLRMVYCVSFYSIRGWILTVGWKYKWPHPCDWGFLLKVSFNHRHLMLIRFSYPKVWHKT